MEKSQTRKANRNSKCLKVDRAIILFEPNSKFAPRPAIMNIVNPETNNKITCTWCGRKVMRLIFFEP